MRIGIDATRANNTQKTGVEWYAYHVIQELKTCLPKEHEVVLYTDKPLQGKLASLPDNWTQKVLTWLPQRFWTQGRLSLEMMLNPPDVLWIPAHVMPLIHPKQTIMTVHDVAAHRFPQSYNWFERWYSVWSARFALNRAHTIISPSKFTKTELIRLQKNPHATIHVIPHGFNKRAKQNQSTQEKTRATKPYFLSISRLEEKKNTVRIIKAFNQFRRTHDNYQLVLIGKPGHGYEQVKQAKESSPYHQDIITPGWIEQDDVQTYLSQATAFVFPSLYEGFGIPVLEAFDAEVPVITSKNMSTEEIAKDAALLVDPLSTKEIVKAMSQVVTQKEDTKKRIARGKTYAAQYSWHACAQQTMETLLGTTKPKMIA